MHRSFDFGSKLRGKRIMVIFVLILIEKSRIEYIEYKDIKLGVHESTSEYIIFLSFTVGQ